VGLRIAFAPLQERQFRLLWLGRISSAVGDALVPVALAFAVLSVNSSQVALGGVLAAFMASRVGFTLIGGVVADRLPRRAVMLACDGVRAAVEAFTATMLLTHQMTLPLFFITGALFGAASAFFGPASDGLVPRTISPGKLQSANALLGLSRSAMNVFGPAVSGVLVAVAGTGWVFALDSLSFVASAIFLLQLRLPAHARAARSHFLRELHEGFREVTSRSWVSAPIIGFAITNFCVASFIVLGPIIFRDHLGGARNWGIVSACGAIGAIVGSLASVRLHPPRPLSFGFLATMLIGVPIAALGPALPVIAIAVAWAGGTASIALSNTYWDTTLQRRIPEAVFSRVRSYDILVSFVFMPIGFVAFPLISRPLGVEATLLGAAALTVVSSLAVAFVPGVRAVTDPDVVTPVAATRAA
jgi:MFS family permease